MSVSKVESPSRPFLNANRKEFRASERICACEIGLESQFHAKDEGDRVTTNDRGQGAAMRLQLLPADYS